ncbi:MAG TPA: transglycosylase domain-containing protein [Xanthobacteraceae bacterium]|nr:transglycosylase domain-containing protein [Xanthobacteraceae bacterium]
MDAILIKVFATALALSQVATRPDAVKVQFDPERDQAEVVQLLRDGCRHMLRAFDIENIDIDDLIQTAMSDKRAAAGEIRVFRGIKFDDLYTAYRQFCKREQVANSPFDAREVILFYNQTTADLPDHTKLKGLRLPATTFIVDGKGRNYAELYEPDSRRVWVPLSEIPTHVQTAFIAAEDKRFYQHKGIDERGVIRAFIGAFGQSGRPQGASTITQQLTKNLLVGDTVSFERKIREMIVASRVEATLTKQEILELYLNTIFLGRNSWGVEMAARSYFGKPVKDVTIAEAALLAALTKGPNAYSPDKNPERARERIAYVISRMQEDGALDAAKARQALSRLPAVTPAHLLRRDTGYHYVDAVAREAKTLAGIDNLTAATYTVRSTIRPDLQLAAETALQDGLARYEMTAGRAVFYGAEVNLAAAVKRLEARPIPGPSKPAWQRALELARLPLYDVHWEPAIVIEGRAATPAPAQQAKGKTTKKGRAQPQATNARTGPLRVGLRNGTILPLSTNRVAMRRELKLHDVVYVNVVEAKGKEPARAELRARPQVQGAAVIIENATGRILAMAGGFSYPLSQLNRVSQSRRQPGSALKPLSYLAALTAGLQPDTLIEDEPITFPPPGGANQYTQEKDFWSPKNYDGTTAGLMTLRAGLEQSRNLVTARLLDGGIADTPEESLDKICALAVEAKIYAECERYYPTVLGSQPVRPLDLAVFFATVANEGGRPTPYLIESIEKDGQEVYRRAAQPLVQLTLADRPALFQLRTILQGVVARGTAASISKLSPFVAGKTGTSQDENDAWFIGFSNHVTIAVWVGYDNSDLRQRRTLGGGRTGANVALPIWTSIMNAVWTNYAKQEPLRGPSPEAAKFLVARATDPHSGERLDGRNPRAFVEYYRTDGNGQIAEAPRRLTSRYDGYGYSDNPFSALFNFFDRGFDRRPPSGYYGGPRDGMRPPGAVPEGSPYPRPRFDLFDRLDRLFR